MPLQPRRSVDPPPREAEDRPRRQHLHISIAPSTIWLAILATVGTLMLLNFLTSITKVLLLLFTAITIGEAMRPAIRWMNKYHIPRWSGVLIIYLIAFGILSALGYLISQPLVTQISQFADNLPEYTREIEDLARQAQGALNGLPGGASVPQEIGNLLNSIAPLILSIPTTIITIVSDFVITLFMALFWIAYSDGLREFFLGFFPPHFRRTGAEVLDEMSIRLGGYVRGVIINMFVIGILAGVAVWLLGLNYALLLGVFAGLTEAIPLVGPFIGAAPAVLLGFTISPSKGIIVALVYLAIQEFEGHTLVPLVMNRIVRLRPLTILVALTIGTLLQGLLGALLAVPFAAVVQVFIVRVLTPWIRRTTGGDVHDTTIEEATAQAREDFTPEEQEESAPHPGEHLANELQASESKESDGVGTRR
ncbi:MAG TPA: AI-2E family transporter [Ktedonobacterales bacterium]